MDEDVYTAGDGNFEGIIIKEDTSERIELYATGTDLHQ